MRAIAIPPSLGGDQLVKAWIQADIAGMLLQGDWV